MPRSRGLGAALAWTLALLGSGLAACGSPAVTAPPRGCQPTPVHYPWTQPGDCVASASHRFVVVLGGYEVLVGNWRRTTDDRGRHLICAGTNVEAAGPDSVPVAPSQYRLGLPSGGTEDGVAAPSNGLARIRLAPGAQEGGTLCWADPGTGGRYAAIFSPSPGPGQRAVWPIRFLPAG